jgi:thioredoxin-related protein
MKFRPALFPSAGILALLLFSTSLCGASRLDQAIAKSKETGAPMFVLVTSPYCVPCATLKRRLETEEEVQGLIGQYVGVHFDMSDPVFRQWTEKYKPRNPMVPMIFVVSSTGQLIYNDSGAPPGQKLVKLLRYGLRQNANQAKEAESPEKAEMKWRAVDKAARSVEAKQYGEAVRTLKPYLSEDGDQAAAGDPSAEEPLAALRAQLRQVGQAHLDYAKTKLASEDKQLYGFLALAQTRRMFGELPELADEIEELHRQFREDEQKAEWFDQVTTIDRGRAADQAGDYRSAIARYREVMAKYPDAKASQMCAIRLQQIMGQRTASNSDTGREIR